MADPWWLCRLCRKASIILLYKSMVKCTWREKKRCSRLLLEKLMLWELWGWRLVAMCCFEAANEVYLFTVLIVLIGVHTVWKYELCMVWIFCFHNLLCVYLVYFLYSQWEYCILKLCVICFICLGLMTWHVKDV